MKKQLIIIMFFMIGMSYGINAQSLNHPDAVQLAKAKSSAILKGTIDPAASAASRQIERIISQTKDLVVSETIHQIWEDGVWENVAKSVYTYNGDAFLLEEISMAWMAGAWQNFYKYVYSYDETGQINIIMGYFWYPETSEWGEFMKMNYIFNDGLISEVYVETNYTGQWMGTSRYLYQYDAMGNMVEQLEIDYDFETSSWVNDDLNTWVFDGNLPIENIEMEWEDGAWHYDNKKTWTYNPQAYYTEELLYYWRSEAWENTEKTTPTYDGAWNITEELTIANYSGAWENSIWKQWTYDGAGNTISKLVQIWEAKGWVYSEKEESTYMLVGTDDLLFPASNTLNVDVGPNPFRNFTTISIDGAASSDLEIGMYNLNGQMVYRVQHPKGIEFPYQFIWSGHNSEGQALENGIYFIRVKTAGQTKVIKTSIIR